MNIHEQEQPKTAFNSLGPDTVINQVEKALSIRCSNLCRPLNSYINRVYELEDESGQGLVAKFYRPGRWSQQALQDEHDFLLELVEDEVPVIAPLALTNNATLGRYEDMFFAVFSKKGGRSFDEYNDDQWLEIGRLLGRTHVVGARKEPQDRITMLPEQSTKDQLEYIIRGGFIPKDLVQPFEDLSYQIIEQIAPMFHGQNTIRIHGDCHFSNLIYRPGESFYVIDLDDMASGVPVQDFWMLLPGYMDESYVEIDLFLEGYETFRPFDRRSLRLIEPLRAMRYIHYTAWCAHQVAEDGLSRVAPDFGTREYWQKEYLDLSDQLEKIRSMPEQMGNFY